MKLEVQKSSVELFAELLFKDLSEREYAPKHKGEIGSIEVSPEYTFIVGPEIGKGGTGRAYEATSVPDAPYPLVIKYAGQYGPMSAMMMDSVVHRESQGTGVTPAILYLSRQLVGRLLE